MSKVALLQITSSDDPVANLTMVRDMMADAKAQGAEWLLTPEVTNCLSGSRTHQNEVLKPQADCPVLAGLRDAASGMGLWVLAGSLAVKSDPPETRFANR
ncbi:MAG: nitrilase-related carbon-nitrogen hydrolase, partial [Pseudomonadota bacterium]|nr:nitrilase-related carbon-nitrogen hydrolase [Pseudomonadota bacterium]